MGFSEQIIKPKERALSDSKQKVRRQRYNRKAQRINDAVLDAKRCQGLSPQQMFAGFLDFITGLEILNQATDSIDAS